MVTTHEISPVIFVAAVNYCHYPVGLPLNETMIAEGLKEVGYSTDGGKVALGETLFGNHS